MNHRGSRPSQDRARGGWASAQGRICAFPHPPEEEERKRDTHTHPLAMNITHLPGNPPFVFSAPDHCQILGPVPARKRRTCMPAGRSHQVLQPLTHEESSQSTSPQINRKPPKRPCFAEQTFDLVQRGGLRAREEVCAHAFSLSPEEEKDTHPRCLGFDEGRLEYIRREWQGLTPLNALPDLLDDIGHVAELAASQHEDRPEEEGNEEEKESAILVQTGKGKSTKQARIASSTCLALHQSTQTKRKKIC